MCTGCEISEEKRTTLLFVAVRHCFSLTRLHFCQMLSLLTGDEWERERERERESSQFKMQAELRIDALQQINSSFRCRH